MRTQGFSQSLNFLAMEEKIDSPPTNLSSRFNVPSLPIHDLDPLRITPSIGDPIVNFIIGLALQNLNRR